MTSVKNKIVFFTGLVIGGLAGAGITFLLAPQSGKKTRTQMIERVTAFRDHMNDDFSEIGHLAQDQVMHWQLQGKEALEKGREGLSHLFDQGEGDFMKMISFSTDDVMRDIEQEENDVLETRGM